MPVIIKKLRLLFEMLALLAVGVLIGSCGSDCPTGPGNPAAYKGWLYATDILNYYLYRIDTETDSVVDSMHCELGDNYMPGWPVCSSDGKYLAISFSDHLNEQSLLRLYDAQTWELISEVNEPINPLFFVENNSMLLTKLGREFIYYSVPGLIPIDSDSMLYSHPNIHRLDIIRINESKHLAYFRVLYYVENSHANCDSICLYAYNYDQKKIEKEWTIDVRDGHGEFYQSAESIVNAGASRFYFLAAAYYSPTVTASVIGYDLNTNQIIFENQIDGCLGDIALTPDEDEIYVVDPGNPGDIWTAGTLYIYDAVTGAYTHGISLYGFTPNRPDVPMFATAIAFTPTGDKAYIGSGLNDKWNGTICSINTSTYSVEDLVWPDFNHIILRLTIGPK